jgi:hypothetical protein
MDVGPPTGRLGLLELIVVPESNEGLNEQKYNNDGTEDCVPVVVKLEEIISSS